MLLPDSVTKQETEGLKRHHQVFGKICQEHVYLRISVTLLDEPALTLQPSLLPQ